MKQMGASIMQGKSLISMSLPINIFEPRSYLQKIAMQMLQAPVYLTRAAKETGLERFKHVLAFYCGLQYVDPIQRKPFNPILGETFQCKIGNYNMALEQTSHHPPVSHFIMWSDEVPLEEQFTINGYLEYRAKTAPNSATARRVGRLQIKFPNDGG